MMIDVYDVLKDEKRKIREDSLVYHFKTGLDYIISIPHCGNFFPYKYKDRFNFSKNLLLDTEFYTDLLYDTGRGIRVISRLNPYFVNMSRPRQITEKSDVKLQNYDCLHPLPLWGGRFMRRDYSKEEKKEIIQYYDTYHMLLQKAINDMKSEYGFALIFDCHSMNSEALPNAPDAGQTRPDFVIGTLDDTSASSDVIEIFMKHIQKHAKNYNLTVVKNNPYKGGLITKKYHDPENHVHVIQIETKKKNFMVEAMHDNPFDAFEIDERGFNIISWIVQETFIRTGEDVRKLYSK
jgi:N-formylglutamate deformylase